MNRGGAETELLLISEAVARLKGGMYAGCKEPEPIANLKKSERWLSKNEPPPSIESEPLPSIGWGPMGWEPQQKDAAKLIYEAIVQGKLSVFVLPAPTDQVHQTHLQVPVGILKRMIRTRGGLPDYTVQPLRIFAKDPILSKDPIVPKDPIAPELLATLSKSALYVRRNDFNAWYKKARMQQVNWPSQRSRCKRPRMGRPSTQNDLRNPIIALVNEGRWSARKTIADLVLLLESQGKIATRDTVRRVIDQLFKETGNQSYRRRVRKRSKLKRIGRGQSIPGI